MRLSVRGADGLLVPPEPDAPFLRHDRASEMRVTPGSLTADGGRIVALDDDPGSTVRLDARGCTLLPGLVDCHTHLPFAGWRASEYEQKITGVPYEKIAAAGGGIAASARAFARADDDQVLAQAHALAGEMLAWGTTTFESKCGYGLTIAAEMRALELAERLSHQVAQTVVSTALLAHAVPAGSTPDSWLDEVASALGDVRTTTTAEALDIFVESVAFTNAHLERMGELAHAHGFTLRCHVEQFSTHRSVPVALAAGARSVDHLACLHLDDIAPLARSECAAVLLPGAEFLGGEPVAPGRALADAGAICVIATDANPGTSPIVALPVIIGLAVRRYGWTPSEALLACTLNAAWVLGRSAEIGSLGVGKRADAILVDGPIEHIPYRFGHNPVVAVIVEGEVAYLRTEDSWRLRR